MNLKTAINSKIMFGKSDLSISNLKEGWCTTFWMRQNPINGLTFLCFNKDCYSKVYPLFMQYNNATFGRVTLKAS